MNDRPTFRRFGIFAHVGNGNLGDEATVAALLQGIREWDPTAEAIIFSANPEDTRRRHQVAALPIRREVAQRLRAAASAVAAHPFTGGARPPGPATRLKAWLKTVPGLRGAINAGRRAARLIAELPGEIGFLWRCFAALRGIDRLIIAGGGQLGDYFGGPWGYPLGIFRWCALARTAGARVAFVSVGAEPIRSPISRWLLRRALALADYRSFRDEGSRLLMERIGVPGDQRVCPDLVHGLRLPAAAPPVRAGAGLTVGINPVPFFDARYWTERDDAVYHHYVSALADFASWLIRRGHRVLFFPTQVHADPPVIHDIELMMKRTAGGWNEDRVLQPLVTDFDSLSAALGMVDVAVASRFHGIIFSILLGTPVLALSYYRKIEDLMTDMGQGDFVLAIKDLDLDSLLRSFSQLEGRLDAVRRETTERRAQYQRALAQQYLELLGSRR